MSSDTGAFAPFRAARYTDPDADVTAPPYDVLDVAAADALRAADPHNIVHLDLPVNLGDAAAGAVSGGGGDAVQDAHRGAASMLEQWVDDGVLDIDPDPAFYLYAQGYRDGSGAQHQTAGVVGALEIGTEGVLPHEQTTPKASSDRLVSLEATRTNLSMIYALSTAADLPALLTPEGPPVMAVTDDEGVHHRLWRITSPARVGAIADAISSDPVVIADGHHRYSVAEQYAASHDVTGADRIMTFVVPLDPEYLAVRPIHRVLPRVGAASDAAEIADALGDVADVKPVESTALLDDPEAGHVIVIAADAAWDCTPRLRPQDSERLARVPEVLRPLTVSWLHEVLLERLGADAAVFHHDRAEVARRVHQGEAALGVLMPPISVADIEEVADADERMPPKTTFFWPKARTGLVLRRFEDQ